MKPGVTVPVIGAVSLLRTTISQTGPVEGVTIKFFGRTAMLCAARAPPYRVKTSDAKSDLNERMIQPPSIKAALYHKKAVASTPCCEN
jgi:hypothetical protein